MNATWADVVAQAPDLARRAEQRLSAGKHHVLGTLRKDGSPRLSGTEVDIADGELTLGMMPDCRKLDDVRRDPRIEIHSAPTDIDLRLPDIKIHGRLVELGPLDSGDGPEGFGFAIRPFSLALISVDGDELVVDLWREGRGVTSTRRR